MMLIDTTNRVAMADWAVYVLIVAASLAAGSKRLTRYGLFGDGDVVADIRAWWRRSPRGSRLPRRTAKLVDGPLTCCAMTWRSKSFSLLRGERPDV
jgi:hypothetical protein